MSIYQVSVKHENPELEEDLYLDAFQSKGEWFINVSSTFSGQDQYTVIAVPLKRFKELVSRCESYKEETDSPHYEKDDGPLTKTQVQAIREISTARGIADDSFTKTLL